MNEALSPAATEALRKIRALRRLPETSGTIAAERRVLNQLNSIETLAVALILQQDDEESEGPQYTRQPPQNSNGGNRAQRS